MSYLLLSPAANVLAGRTVTSTAGTPDTDHPVSWLTDFRPAFPARWAAGAWGASISVATLPIQLLVLANHWLDANVTVGGTAGLAGTIVVPAARPNGIRYNPFKYYTSPVTGVTTITLAGTNTNPAIIGECFGGVPVAIPSFQLADKHDELFDGGGDLGGDFMNIPTHDQGREWRVYGGTQAFTAAEMDVIYQCFEAQRGGSVPTVLILDKAVNDARVVQLGRPRFDQFESGNYFKAQLTFVEYPRYRWIG